MPAITALIDTTPKAAAIQPFTPDLQLLQQPQNEKENPFSSFLNAAINMVNDTNALQVQSEQIQLDFATGVTDDIIAMQLAMDRASQSLNFTAQVTNKIIEAYREIMRMQV